MHPFPSENDDCVGVVQRRQSIDSGELLYRRDTPFATLFLVSRGAIKTQRVTSDGGMVVTGFHLPGEIVGLDTIGDTHYRCDAIATTDSEICRLNFQRLLNHCSHVPAVHAWVIARIGVHLRQRESDLSWAARMRSEDRVLRFFVDLQRRLVEGPFAEHGVQSRLPMKKQDIAMYLQMSPETLSRNLTKLRERGLLLTDDDWFDIPDPDRARRMTAL